MRVPNHIVNEDGHAFAQPHLEVLLMRHVTGLLAEMFHWQCFNHYWISDVVTAPESLFFSRLGRLYWHKLGEDKVQEVDQSRQGDSGQKLSEQGKQSFRFVFQVPHTYQVNHSVTKLNFLVDGLTLLNGILAHCQDFTPPSVSFQVERCSIACSINCSSSGLSL